MKQQNYVEKKLLRNVVYFLVVSILSLQETKGNQERYAMSCIFCDIVKKKKAANIIFEDEYALAFHDINPQAPIHVLIIPKKHIPTSLDIKEEESFLLDHLFKVTNKIARDKGIADRGFRLVINCNREAGQTVFHMHIHLLGGRIMYWPPG
jgi:histidine triad (HIT) family protein